MIEVGEYVRTKYGIAKVEKVEVDKPHKTIWYTVDKPQYYCFLVREQEVFKSSKNIIGLIKVGDYVNGEKVFNINNCLYGGKQVIITELNKVYFDNMIKSIVTKDQFEAIEYKVEE